MSEPRTQRSEVSGVATAYSVALPARLGEVDAMQGPLAYFITFTCYGNWLHGDERGSVDLHHNAPGTPIVAPDLQRVAQDRDRLSEPPYQLDAARRRIALQALCAIAERKKWLLHAVHVRPSHIHVIVSAPGPPERVMNDLKAAASRCLKNTYPEENGRTRWTRHGSTRYLWSEEAVPEKARYVLDGQGEPMERFPDQRPSRARSAAE